MTAAVCKGVVHENTVLLENGVTLPEGAEVEVRVVQPAPSRDAAFEQVLAGSVRRFVGMDAVIAEDKDERDDPSDR